MDKFLYELANENENKNQGLIRDFMKFVCAIIILAAFIALSAAFITA